MKSVPLSEARDKLSTLVDEADTTHEIIHERNRLPQARRDRRGWAPRLATVGLCRCPCVQPVDRVPAKISRWPSFGVAWNDDVPLVAAVRMGQGIDKRPTWDVIRVGVVFLNDF